MYSYNYNSDDHYGAFNSIICNVSYDNIIIGCVCDRINFMFFTYTRKSKKE